VIGKGGRGLSNIVLVGGTGLLSVGTFSGGGGGGGGLLFIGPGG